MPKLTTEAIEIRPGEYRWFGYPEGHFIPGREAIRRLTPTLAGFHGHEGRFQPYAAVAQVLGEGFPTPRHQWWKAVQEIETPTENIGRMGARQFLVHGEFIDPTGEQFVHNFATNIGFGYDIDEMSDRLQSFIETGETPPGEPLPMEERLTLIGIRVEQLDWEFVGGANP